MPLLPHSQRLTTPPSQGRYVVGYTSKSEKKRRFRIRVRGCPRAQTEDVMFPFEI